MAGTQTEFDENTTDPVALAAMFDQMEASTANPPAPAAVTEEPAAAVAAPAAAEPAAQAKTETKTEAAAEPDPDGVATKDGKHIIPYSVLKADREARTRAEQALRDAQDKLATFEAAAKAGTGVPGEPAVTAQPNVSDMSDEDLEILKEDFPTVYKGLMAMQAQAAALQAQLKPVQESVQSAEARRAQTVAENVQEAIDATPKLAHIKATDPAVFELAKQFDNTLKGQAAWADKALSERFAKVIELVEQANGAITIPGQAATPAVQKTAAELKVEAQVLAAAAAKATKTNVPTSLSEFAAGESPAKDNAEAAENMSPMQLAAMFAAMSPDKLDAYLQNL